MKLLIGLGFKWSFVSIFHFPVPRARFPLPVPRFSNIPVCPQILHKLMLLGGLHFPIRGGGGGGGREQIEVGFKNCQYLGYHSNILSF